MKSERPDYLKYWRIIRQFYKVKFGLTQCDLDMLLFLNTEGYFTKDTFIEFDELLAWDNKRFDRLKRDGWIHVFRPRLKNKKAIYEITPKTKRLITEIYKKLNGEEIAMSPGSNPMFMKKVSYTDKVYRNMIKTMNKSIKQQRHQTHE